MLDAKEAERQLVAVTNILKRFVGRKGYYLDSGTLLGFVRDGAINQYDHDIDIRILPDKLPEERMPELVSELWQIGYRSILSNVGKRAELICVDLETLMKLDLKFAFKDENLLWVYCWEQPCDIGEPKIHAYPIRFFKKMGTVKFKDRAYSCPTPVEEYLEWHYGKDWRKFKARPEDAEETDLTWDWMKSPPCSMSPSELMAKRKEIINYKKGVSVNKSEYDVALACSAPIILDIGACIGTFSIWALKRWDKAKIYAYEPITNNFESLVENTKELNVMPIKGAVRNNGSGTGIMYQGLHNCGEASFYNLGGQNLDLTETVEIIAAKSLPKADIVKIDTEGCEVEILQGLDLSNTKAVMLEAHREEDIGQIREILKDFDLISTVENLRNRWLMKFVKQSVTSTRVEAFEANKGKR